MPGVPVPPYLAQIVRMGMETLAKALRKEMQGEGYEFIVMVLPYHITQVKHLSTEQRTLMEKKVAIAAQQELLALLGEKGKGPV